MVRNDSLVPDAKSGLKKLEAKVMSEKGYKVNKDQPENVKYEVAKDIGVPLKNGDNGNMTAKQAGKIGGTIGGPMVKELIKMAQKNVLNK